MNDDLDRTLARLHDELRLVPPRLGWAKAELLGGLAAAVTGLFSGFRVLLGPSPGLVPAAASALLVVAGTYLALAGHRSHLYRSMNRLAAWVVVRTGSSPG